MDEFYLLDENLERKHIIDVYSSAIWNKSYNETGDCELAIPATKTNLNKISESKYIAREDDDMVCTITKIEIETDVEDGDSLIITGTDIKCILNQRIVMSQTNFNGTVENYIRTLITDSIINPSNSDRKIDNFILADAVGFSETICEQVTYSNVGEKVQELCKTYGWGYRITVSDVNFVFELYKGNDKSEYVTFSQNSDNIATTDYSVDTSNMKNVALIAGEGEGVDRVTTTIGEGTGINRHELYVDARDVSSSIDYDELVASYPNGSQVTVSGVTYYQVNGVNIAIITFDEDGEVSEVTLCDDIYLESLESTGEERIADYVTVTSFSGEIIVGLGYTYKEDYDLGDIVNIENEYGISMDVRISEILESRDSKGYKLEPTFENIE